MEKNKLTILFPGVRYSVDCPLLYYPSMWYEEKGFQVISANYHVKKTDGIKKQEEYIKQAKKGLKKQFLNFPFENYDEIRFVSKSIGTILALWLEEELGISNVEHVLLTPIERTLPFLKRKRNCIYMASGTADKMVDHERLQKVCKKMNYPLQEFDGLGHRLEPAAEKKEGIQIDADIEQSLDVIREIVTHLR